MDSGIISLPISVISLVISFFAFRRDSRHLTVRFKRNVLAAREGEGPVDRAPFMEWTATGEDDVIRLSVGEDTSKEPAPRVACVTIINDGRRPNRLETVVLVTDGHLIFRTKVPMKELPEGAHCDIEFPETILSKSPEEPFAARVIDIYNRMYVSPMGWSLREIRERLYVLRRNLSFALGLRKR